MKCIFMKKTLTYLTATALLLLFLGSCNIKAPIEEMLPEGNDHAAPVIALSGSTDTILIKQFLPQIGTFDSIVSKTLTVRGRKTKGDLFLLLNNKSNTPLHEIQLWKGGKRTTLIAIRAAGGKTIQLSMRSFLNNVIFVKSLGKPRQIIATWQNTIIPARFISFSDNGISIFIPKEAKSLTNSTIRIFVADENQNIGQLAIELINGEPKNTQFTTR